MVGRTPGCDLSQWLNRLVKVVKAAYYDRNVNSGLCIEIANRSSEVRSWFGTGDVVEGRNEEATWDCQCSDAEAALVLA